MRDVRRESPRIGIEALCWELVGGKELSGIAVELSPAGLRLERPYTGGPTRREVPLQLEVPGIDEVMWAKADACFDHLVPATGPAGGPLGLIRRTGYRIVAAATRDLRMLRELVVETDRAHRRAQSLTAEVEDPRGAARGGVNPPALPAERGREGPLSIDLSLAACYLRG